MQLTEDDLPQLRLLDAIRHHGQLDCAKEHDDLGRRIPAPARMAATPRIGCTHSLTRVAVLHSGMHWWCKRLAGMASWCMKGAGSRSCMTGSVLLQRHP